ncbi:hypothetical protein C8A01DRAFT_12687 [Parachaetomium inaequale]|uniref:Uncharacterized protein n=1 Tax=Parachaetomium inaequale TaxID=2588326 RepID=A0AAN6PN51_9PEZI|nr:hypothetical protein C8A01DRAFT_12687 [Parachaetomium inaequale]
MDLASPSSDLSTGSSAGTEATQQPTYTTVGSIYNPKTTTPLQPPTRRPRTRRYPQPIQSPAGGTFMPFPDALLSALPLEDQAPPSPPTTASILRQYSPLQQNCDRAATPVTERENPVFADYNMSMPSIRSGNLPSPTGFESNGSVAAEDTLTSRITVKGLTSLASYPNPMQKAAQNTLARARAANLDLSRPGTPSSLPSTTPDLSKDRLFNTYGVKPATAGPPQPLKAGPPGQRAFKPTTLESASRSLRVEDQLPPALYQSRSPIGFQYNLDANILPTFDDDHDGIEGAGRQVQLPLDERHHGAVSRHPHEFTGFGRLATPSPFDTVPEALDGGRRKVHDTLPPEKIKHYFPGGFPSNYDGRHKPVPDDWHTKYPTAEDRFMQETFSERMTKINRNFYAGTEGLVRNMEQIVRDHNYRCLENKVGVIGEERERLRGSHIERLGADGKVQPPALSVDEVHRMSEADVAKPLVNMAFATLLSYKEESESGASASNAWPSGFTKADDAWVDDTEEGNTSFFTKPKDDQLRKKKVPKKARRGY